MNISILQKTDLLIAKEELRQAFQLYGYADEGIEKTEQKLALLRLVRKTHPVLVKTRDPELAELVQAIEKKLEAPAE